MSRRHYLGLCAIAKDETPFLREWVAYHHLIGFERIIVYDNESAVPAREVLADMIDAGWVETYFIEGKTVQLTAYHHCLITHGAEFEWLAFFDLDEFLLIENEMDARALLCAYDDYAGLAVNMVAFSSAGKLGRPTGLCMENYTERIGPGLSVKCMVRPDKVKLILTPHDIHLEEGCFTVNTDRLPVFGAYTPVTVDTAVLNHYFYRSQQDFEEKLQRGDAIYMGESARKMLQFYQHLEKLATRDTRILRHVGRVRAIMDGEDCPYIALDTSIAFTEPFAAALSRLVKDVESGERERARLLFLLNRKRFQDKAAYLTMGFRACLAAGDHASAESAARALLVLAPVLSSYCHFLSLYLSRGERARAEHMAYFLLRNAGGKEEHKGIAEFARAAIEEHGLSVDI